MALTEFAVAERKIAVAAQARIKELNVPRTVHRFERVVAVFRFGCKHIAAVLGPMTGALPQRAIEQLRCLNFLIAIFAINAAHELFNTLPQRPTLGMPKDQTRSFLLQMEKIEFLAQTAMVTLFGLGEHREIGFLIFFLCPGSTIDALQHFVLAVATPICTGHLHELEDLEFARARYVRSAAQIREVSLTVKRNNFSCRNFADNFSLVVLADALEICNGFIARQRIALERNVLFHKFLHSSFDLFEIFGREGALKLEVVVKAIFNGRSDRHFSRRVKLLDSLSHQVRSRVTNQLKSFGVLCRDDGNVGIRLNNVRQIDELVVNLAGKSSLGKAGTDRCSNVTHRERSFVLANGTVGQSDGKHF